VLCLDVDEIMGMGTDLVSSLWFVICVHFQWKNVVEGILKQI
jgi:hypothetical protein